MPRPPRRLPEPRAMIVAPQPEAVEAGADMLRSGGNALDAALACAFAQGVVDPMMCGLGGLGVLHILDPRRGEPIVYDGLSPCPRAARETMWEALYEGECSDGYGYRVTGALNELGHQAVTVPAILRAFADAHAAHGRMPWRALFAAAIPLAAEGWMVRPHVHTMFTAEERAYGRRNMVEKLGYTAEGAALYLRPDGTPKRPGDMVRNPALAATLGNIAEGGAEAFYSGAIARGIAEDMARNGGLVTLEDLAAVTVPRVAPLSVPYRGYTLLLPPPPAGGIVVAEILRILERFDLAALGHNSADYVAVLAEAMKIAGRDKDRHIGDPAFVPPPLELLLGDAYADACAARIRAGERVTLARAAPESRDTTTISCVDADGMVVSITHTLGLPSGVIPPGTGFMLNGAMNWYDPRPGRASSIGPGKRRFSSMAPMMVMQDGRPVATLGAPGGAWIGIAIAQAVVNLLDWGMTMQEAVMAPRISATAETIDLSNRIPRAVEAALEAKGYATKRYPIGFAFAAVHGITLYDGRLEGGADPQRDGYAAGVA